MNKFEMLNTYVNNMTGYANRNADMVNGVKIELQNLVDFTDSLINEVVNTKCKKATGIFESVQNLIVEQYCENDNQLYATKIIISEMLYNINKALKVA
ncbi:MAG: hypothetical protein R3Y32_00165 [Bacillota bacterium]